MAAKPVSDLIEVTQADREAAADLIGSLGNPANPYVQDVREGRADEHLFVLAFARHALNTLSALEAEGWVVTPKEPTEAMIETGGGRLARCSEELREENYISGETPDWDYEMEAEAAYRAMLSARPEPSKP